MKNIIFHSLTILCWIVLSTPNIQAQCNPNCVQTTNLNFSTGWDETTGSLVNAGQADPHWRLMNVPPLTGTPPASVNSPTAHIINPYQTNWNVIAGSRPLSMASTASFGPDNANGIQPWRFRRYFCVCEDTEVVLSGAIRADDTGSLKLYDSNGNPTPFSVTLPPAPNTANFYSDTPYNQALSLPAGNYYFEFELFNTDGVASGFAVQGQLNSTTSLALYDEQIGCCAVSVITGQKILDENCNGKFDAGVDQVGAGFTFDLIDNSNGALVATTTSDALGEFEFNNVAPGFYTVSEQSTPGWQAQQQSITVNLDPLDVQTVTFFNCRTPTLGEWKKIYGDEDDNRPTKIKAFGNHVYVTGYEDIGGVFYATVSKFDALDGSLSCHTRLSFPSRISDFEYDSTNDALIVVGAEGNQSPGINNTAGGDRSFMIKIDNNCTPGAYKFYDHPGREAFTRIVRHPNPKNTAFPYYALGRKNPVNNAPSTFDLAMVYNFNENLIAQWIRHYETSVEIEAYRLLIPLNDGELLIGGNSSDFGNGTINDGIIIEIDGASGNVLGTAAYPGVIDLYDGADLGNNQVVLTGHDFGQDQALMYIINRTDYSVQDGFRFSDISRFNEIGLDANGFIYTLGQIKTGSQRHPVIHKFSYTNNGGSSALNPLYYRYLTSAGSTDFDEYHFSVTPDLDAIFYTDARRPVTSGFGDYDMLISIINLDFTSGCTEDFAQTPIPYTISHLNFGVNDIDPGESNLAVQFSGQDPGYNCENTCFSSIPDCEALAITPLPLSNNDGLCCNTFDYQNNSPQPVYALCIRIPFWSTAVLSNVTADPAFNLTFNPVTNVIELTNATLGPLPSGSISNALEFCAGNLIGDYLVVDYLWKDQSGEVVCEDLDEIYCEPSNDLECNFTWEANCCEIDLFGSSLGGTAPYTYEWDIECDDSFTPPDITGQNVGWIFASPGTYSVCLRVTDAAGLSCEIQQSITVTDDPPTLVCPPSITISTDPGLCVATHQLVDPIATDDCTTIFFPSCSMSGATIGPAISPVTLNKGITIINCAIEDSKGQMADCQYQIEVIDEEPPLIICPDPITVSGVFCEGFAQVNLPDPIVTDNCPMVTYICSHQSGFFPCGTTMVTCTATDMAGNETVCTYPVVVDCPCAEVDQGEIDCTDVDDQFAFSFDVLDLNGTGFGSSCTVNVSSNQAGVTVSNVVVTGTSPNYTVSGIIDVAAPPMPNFITLTIDVSCTCPDGTVNECSFTRTLETPCCKEISVDPQEVCKNASSVTIPLQGCSSLYDVQQVRWYVSDTPCSSPNWILLQVTNGCAPLNLSPQYHNGDICVYAEVDMGPGAGPCRMLTSNIATITLCDPVSFTVNSDQAECWTGTPFTPAPLSITFTSNECVDAIEWYDPQGNLIPSASGQLMYQPPSLSFTLPNTECSQTYTYQVNVTNECGTQSQSVNIRLDNDDAPLGTLSLLPPDVNPLCYGEDAILEYEPECAGDMPRWDWYERTASTTYQQLNNNGTQNPIYYTNRLYEDTWVKVEKMNGVCPADELELMLDVIDPVTITSFTAAYDDICAPAQVDLTVDVQPNPADPSCSYNIHWYRNGQLVTTSTSVSSTPVNYVYTGFPLWGNYYAIVENSCCPGRVKSQVVTLEPTCELVIDGPCFRCKEEVITLNGIIIDPMTGFNCSYQWYNNGIAIPGETGQSLTVSPLWNGTFTLEATCTNGTDVCVKTAAYTLLQCGNGSTNVCEGNLVQNGDFEIGTPTNFDEDINLAGNWNAIWQSTTGFSTADFYNTSTALPPYPAPTPTSQNNFAGMWSAYVGGQQFREGIMNELSTTILPGTGKYELTFKVACLGGYFNTPTLSIWAVDAPAGLASGASPTSFSMPTNDGFYGAANSYEIGTHAFPATCDEQFITLTYTLDTWHPAFPATGVSHIFFTRADGISGGVYIALDDVCLTEMSCCGITQADFDAAVQTGFSVNTTVSSTTIDNALISGDGCYEMTINWQDGTTETINGSELPFSHTYTASGMYNITIDVEVNDTDGTNCFSDQYQNTITDTGEPITAEQVDIFPNPTQQAITVRWQGQVVYQHIVVRDMNGRDLRQFTIPESAQMTEIDMRRFPAGVYLIQLRAKDGQVVNRRVVKQ